MILYTPEKVSIVTDTPVDGPQGDGMGFDLPDFYHLGDDDLRVPIGYEIHPMFSVLSCSITS
jgi:hypothetical protein